MTENETNGRLDVVDQADRKSDTENCARNAFLNDVIGSLRAPGQQDRPDVTDNHNPFAAPETEEDLERPADAFAEIAEKGMYEFLGQEESIKKLLTKAAQEGSFGEVVRLANEKLQERHPNLHLSGWSDKPQIRGDFKFNQFTVMLHDSDIKERIARPTVDINIKTAIPRGPNRLPVLDFCGTSRD